MIGMVLRRAVLADLEAILSIENTVFTDAWSAQSYLCEFEDVYSWFQVAEVDGRVAGFVLARMVAQQGEIVNIAVDPAHHGSGLGGRLLDAAIAAAVAADCEAVWLEVRVTNEAAKRLYVSRGFEAIGIRKRYYDKPVEDASVLRRVLPVTGAQAEK